VGNSDVAIPEQIPEFEPGNPNCYQDQKSVELVSPIAASCLYTQLKIHWST